MAEFDISFVYTKGGYPAKSPAKNLQPLLKIFLLSRLNKLLYESFQEAIEHDFTYPVNFQMESYVMDNKVIQYVIRDIVQSGEYSLEGIAYYTRIPLDVIFDAACGNNCHLSVTSWFRIIELYIHAKPEIPEKLLEKLQKLKDKQELILSFVR